MIAMLRILSMQSFPGGQKTDGVTDPGYNESAEYGSDRPERQPRERIPSSENENGGPSAWPAVRCSTHSLLPQALIDGRLGIDEAVAIGWRIAATDFISECPSKGAASGGCPTEGHSVSELPALGQ